MSTSSPHPHPRLAVAFANVLVRRPLAALGVLVALFALSLWGASRLAINSNQLDLISQDLPEVQDVKRVIDMVGGSGFLMIALRADDEATLKRVADDVAARLTADKENVRSVSYKLPVEFIQQQMALFVKTEDLAEVRKRVNAFLKDQLRRNNPFFIELRKTEPVKLELQDIVDRYSSVGKKSIVDDYNISPDKKMLLLLIKPMWDTNELSKTKTFVEKLDRDFAEYSKTNPAGVKLVEDYQLMGDKKTVAYGYTGSYKTAVDDSYAIEQSLGPVGLIAFVAILLIIMVFFRKWLPSVVVMTGVVIGTVFTMGFTYVTVGQLNMITSILGGILLGMGIDYGIHFIFRTRLELGAGKPYDVAIQDAFLNAGRPALVSAVVTGGSFAVLMFSDFRGFSQFGFLAGVGSLITCVTLFTWTPALLALIGRRSPALLVKLIGTMKPPASLNEGGEIRIPNPKLVLGICIAIVALFCSFAIPWADRPLPAGRKPTLSERFLGGVRFNYNTRALMPDDQYSVKLQDEINARFKISSDPIAIYTKTLEEAKEVYEEMTQHKDRYPAVDQVVSIFTFVPPPRSAAANAEILKEWDEELKEIDVASLPPELQEKAAIFKKMLQARPFDVTGVPESYVNQFRHLPTTKPENHGWLTYVYPSVDLWDGKNVLAFADQTSAIKTASGKVFRAAGGAPLYAKLARIVLADGKLTVMLTAVWILLMHFLDFRNTKLALASVIPLGVGLLMMLGVMSMFDLRLNFMNIIILPILLGFGVSHGLYLLHRFLEGTSPIVALRSVGAAVAASTLTTAAGFAALLAASHHGLKSMGVISCIGLVIMLIVSFTVLAAVLQLMHDQRTRKAREPAKRAA